MSSPPTFYKTARIFVLSKSCWATQTFQLPKFTRILPTKLSETSTKNSTARENEEIEQTVYNSHMKIVSWNVNGLRSLAKNGYWESFLKGTKPDIFCLQETKASPEQLPEAMLSPAGYSAFFSSCQVRKGYSGVAIYSKVEPLKVIYGMGIKEFDQEGRLVGAEYDDFWLVNAYFPNGGQGPERLDYKMRFYDAFLTFVGKLHKQKPVIFCGDVNTAHEEIDLARPQENED